MAENNNENRWKPLTRRRFLSAAASIGTLTIAGCGGAAYPAPPPPAPPPPLPSPPPPPPPAGSISGLDFTGAGNVRRMLYWDNPFPIYGNGNNASGTAGGNGV